MARSGQILLLFLFAACAVQGYSHGSRHSSHGRSHGRHNEPYDYRHRHRSYHGNVKHRDRSHYDITSTPEPITYAPYGVQDDEEKPVDANTININGLTPEDNKPDVGGTIIVDGLSPDGMKPGSVDGIPSTPMRGDEIPDIKPDYPIHKNGAINVNGISPVGHENKQKNDNTININGLTPGGIPNENDKPNSGGNQGNVNENGLPNGEHKSNIDGNIDFGGLPSEKYKPDQGNGNMNVPDTGDNTIHINGVTPGPDDNKLTGDSGLPSKHEHKLDEHSGNDITRPDHNINVDDLSPDTHSGKLNNDDHTNVHGLLPGGDGENPDHGHGNIDEGGLTELGKPDHHSNLNIDGSKPSGHQPDTSDLHNNKLPSGGVEDALPGNSKHDPITPTYPDTVSPLDHYGKDRHPSERHGEHEQPREPNNRYPTSPRRFYPGHHIIQGPLYPGKVNNSVLLPVYLPSFNGHAVYPNGAVSHEGQVPAFYIVMINGHAMLVRNPAAAMGGIGGKIDLSSLLSGDGGISIGDLTNINGLLPLLLGIGGTGTGSADIGNIGISGGIGGLPQQPIWIGSQYPNIGGYPGGPIISLLPNNNVPSLIPAEPPVITEQVPVPQPIPQPIYPQPYPYPVPEPISPSGPIISYPNLPYPYPWPIWDNNMYPALPNFNITSTYPRYPNPLPSLDWPSIFNFLLHISSQVPNPYPQPPISVPNKPNGGTDQPSQVPLIPEHDDPKNPNVNPTVQPPQPSYPDVSPTPRPIPEKPQNPITPNPGQEHVTNAYPTIPGLDVTPKPNPSPQPVPPVTVEPLPSERPTISTYPNPSPSPTETITSKRPEVVVTPKPTEKPVTPVVPIPTEKPYPPKVNVIPKRDPNEPESHPRPPQRQPVGTIPTDKPTYPGSKALNPEKPRNPGSTGIHLHIPITNNPGPSHGEKTKQKPDSFQISLINLLNNILKLPNRVPNPKPKPSKDIGSLVKLLQVILKPNSEDKDLKEILALLKQKGDNQPNLGNISQLLLHLLDGRSQPNMNILVEPGMDQATRSNLILLLNLLASNLASDYAPGMGYYESMTAANPLLYFLGHFPCDHPNIQAISGGQGGLQRGLWQLLSNMYGGGMGGLGGMGSLNEIRLERSASEDEDNKTTTTTPIPVVSDGSV